MLSRLLPASRTRVLCVQHPTTAARPAPGGQVFILSISGIPRNTSFLPFRATSCNFATLRRSRKGVLRGPGPWTKKVFSVVLRGPSWTKKVFSVVLRGPSWTKKVFLVVLRGPSWTKKVFSVVLRGPPWTKKGVLSGPSWPFGPSWTKKVFSVALDKKGVLPWPSVDKKGVLCGPRGPPWTKKKFLVVLRGPSRTKKGLSGPSRPFVDPPRPFADRPNYNLANLSSDKRQRALVQHLPSPPGPLQSLVIRPY